MTVATRPDEELRRADAAFGRGDLDGAVAHLAAAVRGFTAVDDRRRAAMACVRLGDAYANGLGNLTAGRAWFTRATRLIGEEPTCVEQGWIAVAPMGCDVDDPDDLLAKAELALERARTFGDVNLETKALADAGLAHVQRGSVVEGMRLLDEAMALACGPADDTGTAAKSVCSFFTACYHAGDFDRAATWQQPLRDRGLIGLEPGGQIFLSSHCDSVQATLLMELGRWSDAEHLLDRAQADFTAVMHTTSSWHPDIALADLRTQQGRLGDAEALLLGKDQSLQALVPAARLHLARGDHDLARAAAERGLRVLGDDCLRAIALLTVLVDAELARGDLDAALEASRQLRDRTCDLDVPALEARAAAARARALAATGALPEAIELMEENLARVDGARLPWLRANLLIGLARLRKQAGDAAGATFDAEAAAAILASLDVVLGHDDLELLARLRRGPGSTAAPSMASLVRDGKWWTASYDGAQVRLPSTKGLAYLAELLARPGVERHVFDLVDRVEGVGVAGEPDRRSLGDAGAALDARARNEYRRRIEHLRAEADDALAGGMLETAEARQAELDDLVAQLAQAFGLGGRERRAGSAAERARLNVTRALRAAITRLTEALPLAGGVLDRRVRTGMYCAYEPTDEDEVRWIVQP
jgi:tetratricopeptide (TPR) repeat protein